MSIKYGGEYGSGSIYGIRVTTNGEQTIQKWVQVMAKASEMVGSLPEGGQLLLGSHTFNDGILGETVSAISYNQDDDTYEMASQFQADLRTSRRGKRGTGNQALASLLEKALAGNSKVIDVQIDELGGNEEQAFNLNSLTLELQRRLKEHPYHIQYDEQKKAVKIVPSEKGVEAASQIDLDNPDSFTLHNATDQTSGSLRKLLGSEEIYCLHVIGAADKDPEKVTRNYRNLGFLTQEVANAIYVLQGRPASPDTEYIIEPASGTDKHLSKIERTLDRAKRMKSMMGLDSDEEIADEVEQKIVMVRRPDTSFDDIGGCEDAKVELQTVVDSLRDPEAYRRWGAKPTRGVLLYGPPGTGKTELVKATAHDAEAALFVVTVADIMHSLYGKAERFVQAVFDRARKEAPSLMFFDELDAIARVRDNSDSVTSRIVSTLLTNMQGIEEKEEPIVVIGTTNRLDAIDPALKRAGRLDHLIEVPLPNEAARKRIFEIKMQAALKRARRDDIFASDFSIDEIVTKTPKFSGADLEEILRRALNQKVREERAYIRGEGPIPGPVNLEDVLAALRRYEPIRVEKERETAGFKVSTKR